MGKKGLLKVEEFGAVMPVTDPYVPGPPTWARTELFRINFETDYESVARRIPEPLEFLNDPPTGTLLCSSAHFVSDSTPHMEANLIYHVTYEGKPYNFFANLFVSQVEALVAGREVYGYPKKFAHMEYYIDSGQICMTVERPKGFRIFSASVRTQRPKQIDPKDVRDILLLKVIPSPIIGAPPQVCQLVGITRSTPPGDAPTPDTWECSGSISWGVNSTEDPWSGVKINKILDAYYTSAPTAVYGSLASGRIVHDYLK
ncbi:MAG: acetoacetate decarboxylase family protein [Clostridiales bacterium]|nr:acetoacetate decarboxylase family protein [Clostridiales bacterium]